MNDQRADEQARELGQRLCSGADGIAMISPAVIAKARLEEVEWLIHAFCLTKSVYSPLIQTHIAQLRKEANVGSAPRSGRGQTVSKSAIQIIQEYIQMLAAGHVKTGTQEVTKEQTELAIALLQAITADIEAAAPATKEE